MFHEVVEIEFRKVELAFKIYHESIKVKERMAEKTIETDEAGLCCE